MAQQIPLAHTALRPDQLYLYHSADGFTRQRCGRHIEASGPYRPTVFYQTLPPDPRHTCVACFWERERKRQEEMRGGETHVDHTQEP